MVSLMDMSKLRASGNVGQAMAALVLGVVVLFVGLFVISIVATAAAVNNTSTFWSVYTGLVSTTGTIFTVAGLALIVAGLGLAIRELMAAF
jgi:hypothetical protein